MGTARSVGPSSSVQALRVSKAFWHNAEHAVHKFRRWSDPRERELRRRRRARRHTLRLGAGAGTGVAGTVGLLSASAPGWVVVVVGGAAAVLTAGAGLSTQRYVRMSHQPLPAATFVPAALPPIGSAARAPMARLVQAQRALHTLGEQISHRGRLPADDLSEALSTADSAAAALHSMAADVAALEQADTPSLAGYIRDSVTRLDTGVTGYEQVVSAAAGILTAPDTSPLPDDFTVACQSLRATTDRLDSWAEALDDLGGRR